MMNVIFYKYECRICKLKDNFELNTLTCYSALEIALQSVYFVICRGIYFKGDQIKIDR